MPRGSRAGAGGGDFADDFSDSDRTERLWKVDHLHGSVTETDGRIVLAEYQGTYPVLCSRSDPFAAAKSTTSATSAAPRWTASFCYRFQGAGTQGGGIVLAQRAQRRPVLALYQAPGSNTESLVLDGKVLIDRRLDTDWHVVSLVRDGGGYTVYDDGTRIGSAPADATPDWIVAGGGGTGPSVGHPFSRLELQFVRVQRGVVPLDKSAARDTEAPERLHRLRSRIAELGVAAWGAQQGRIGRVNGIAITMQGGIPVDSSILTVDATVVPGSGRVSVQADVLSDAEHAAENAAAYAKSKVAAMGANVPWSQRDVVVAYPHEYLLMSGNSAGVADATAVLSAALQAPVDANAAMTGAIGLQGQVDPVGGVALKFTGAIRDGATVVIVPADWYSADELNGLYASEPEAFFGHRVIFARTMEDVLRHALIGYDPRRDQAAAAMRRGLRLFEDGEDARAISEFRAAQSLTPEDQTIAVWIRYVQGLPHAEGKG